MKSNFKVFVLACLAALFSTAASAQDSSEWDGLYVGAGIGGYWGQTDWTGSGPTIFPIPVSPVTADFDGVLFTGKLGYRYQTGPWVFGVEGEIGFGDVGGSTGCLVDTGGAPGVVAKTCEAELQYQLLAGIQIGYAVDNWLPYFTAGYNHAEVDARHIGGGVGVADHRGSGSHDGGYVGAGVDYKLSQNLSIGAEVKYLWYNADTYIMSAPGSVSSSNIELDPLNAQINVKYKFGG